MEALLPLAKCNNCERLWVDTNPQTGQKEFEIEMDYPTLEEVEVKYTVLNGEHVEKHWVCPNCKTDGYLSDFEGEIDYVRDDYGVVVRVKERKLYGTK